MTIPLILVAALWFGHLVASRSRREARWHAARERRRRCREQQWRAMILDAEERRR